MKPSNKRRVLLIISAVGLISAVFGIITFVSGYTGIPDALSALRRVFVSKQTSGSVGEILYDEYLTVSVDEPVKGTLLSDSKYDISCSIANRTSEDLYITAIESRRFNSDYSTDGSPTYTLIEVTELLLKGHEKSVHIIKGNSVLPKSIVVRFTHNLSKVPSEFRIDLKSRYLSPLPYHELPTGSIFVGYDGGDALQSAVSVARTNGDNIYFFSMYPVDETIVFDRDSGLKIAVVDRWYVSLINEANTILPFIVGRDSIEQQPTLPSSIPLRKVPIPTIGNQHAIEIATRKGWTCGNWDDMKLLGGMLDGKWTAAWVLPYLDSHSEVLMIDANSGDRVSMTIESGTNLLNDLAVFKKTEQ